jgi:hypothetical protein
MEIVSNLIINFQFSDIIDVEEIINYQIRLSIETINYQIVLRQ